jgi:hypothetical protein
MCLSARPEAAPRFRRSGDLAPGHVLCDVGAAHRGAGMAGDRGEIEPLVRLDQIAGLAMRSCRECDAEVEKGGKVVARGRGEAAGDECIGGRRCLREPAVDDRHSGHGVYPMLTASPLGPPLSAGLPVIVNKWLTPHDFCARDLRRGYRRGSEAFAACAGMGAEL